MLLTGKFVLESFAN